jgi:hypothetical protein
MPDPRRELVGQRRPPPKLPGQHSGRQGPQPCTNEDLANHDTVDRECDRAYHHRVALHGRVAGTVLVDGDAERGKCDRGAAPNNPAKLLGRRTSPSIAKADTTAPPMKKRRTYSVISLSGRDR